MTMGPAPMIRIELMSVRLGIVGLPSGHKKRRRRTRALRQPRAADFARRRSLSPESPEREGLWLFRHPTRSPTEIGCCRFRNGSMRQIGNVRLGGAIDLPRRGGKASSRPCHEGHAGLVVADVGL